MEDIKECGFWSDYLIENEISFSKYAYKQLLEEEPFKNFCKKVSKSIKDSETPNPNRVLSEINRIKSDLLEARFIYELFLSEKCSDIEYEFKTGLNNSSVDFKFLDKQNNTWYIELTSLRDSSAVKKATTQDGIFYNYYSHNDPNSEENSSEVLDIIKTQNALINKTVNKNKNPIKFAIPDENTFNVIVIDMRAFNAGGYDGYDCRLISYGNNATPYPLFFNKKPIVGIFEESHPNENAKFIRERVHFIMFIKEKSYEQDEIKKQHIAYPNINLFGTSEKAKEVWDYFPLSRITE